MELWNFWTIKSTVVMGKNLGAKNMKGASENIFGIVASTREDFEHT